MHAATQPGPGRPREFELQTAVEDAIAVFQAQGYHGTSVQDLTIGTGIGRGSLYKAFHDKRALFLAALAHYTSQALHRLADDLAHPGPARDALRRTLMGYAERAAEGQSGGCLVVGAAMELMPQDIEVGVIVNRYFQRVQDLFAATVIRGQAAGEIPETSDERAIARLLLCTVQGMRILNRTCPAHAEIERMFDTVLQVLD